MAGRKSERKKKLLETDATYTNPYCSSIDNDDLDEFMRLAVELYQDLYKSDPPIIKNRKYHMQVYKACFRGDELITWLVNQFQVQDRNEGVAVGRMLLMHGLIHHVCDDHTFKDEGLFYRFCRDDANDPDTNKLNPSNFDNEFCAAVAEETEDVDKFSRLSGALYKELHAQNMIKNRRYHLQTFKLCFKGDDLISYFMQTGKAKSRVEGLVIGRLLLNHGIIHHVCDDHVFKDEGLFYRFHRDDGTPQKILNSGSMHRSKSTYYADFIPRYRSRFTGSNSVCSDYETPASLDGQSIYSDASEIFDMSDDAAASGDYSNLEGEAVDDGECPTERHDFC